MYAEINSEFHKFFQRMTQLVKHGELSLILRYKPDTVNMGNRLTVVGYGVELAVKNTEYKVSDDRDTNNIPAGSDLKEQSQFLNIFEEDEPTVQKSSKNDIECTLVNVVLSPKAVSFVLNSTSPFETLVELTRNFPIYAHHLNPLTYSKAALKLGEKLNGMFESDSLLLLNGRNIPVNQLNMFVIMDMLLEESQLMDACTGFGLNVGQCHEIITSSPSDQKGIVFDTRSPHFIWLNDVEKDKKYSRLSTSWTSLLYRQPVRKNLVSIVLFVNLGIPIHVELIQNCLILIEKGVPIRFSMVATGELQNDQSFSIFS